MDSSHPVNQSLGQAIGGSINPNKSAKNIDQIGMQTPRRALNDKKNTFATPVGSAIKKTLCSTAKRTAVPFGVLVESPQKDNKVDNVREDDKEKCKGPADEEKMEVVREEQEELVVEQEEGSVEEMETESVAEQGAEDVVQHGAEVVAQQGAEPVAEQGAEDVAQQGAESVAEQGAEDVGQQGAELVVEQEVEPVVEQEAEPVVEQEAEPVDEQGAASGAEQGAQPVIEQEEEPVVEQEEEPVDDQGAEPVAEQFLIVNPRAENNALLGAELDLDVTQDDSEDECEEFNFSDDGPAETFDDMFGVDPDFDLGDELHRVLTTSSGDYGLYANLMTREQFEAVKNMTADELFGALDKWSAENH